MKQGPNVRKLIAHRAAVLAVPVGGKGLADAVAAITEPGKIVKLTKEATEWVKEALNAVKMSRGNPWPDDETIAGEILRSIESRQRTIQRLRPGPK